jgi:hypothetical protein
MAAAKRPSPELTNKININPVGNRLHEATAEDYIETAEILNDHADKIDAMKTTESGKPFYGFFTSLALLQAAYPTGTLNALAIIDSGIGATPQLALWDNNDMVWVINSVAENVKFVETISLLPAPGLENMIYITLDNFKAYVWKNSQYNLIFTLKNTSDLTNDGDDGINPFLTFTDIFTENKVLDYTIQWIPGTYTFKITVRKYIFNGILHTNTIYAERTLGASDTVYNRFDSFLIDANEQIIVWPGDAVEFPYPKEFDLDTYVLINFFRVDANTTEPAGLNEILVFNEGTNEAGGEWNMTYPSGTLDTTKFSSGAKSIKLVNKQSVAATAGVNYEGRFIKDVLIDVWCDTPNTANRLRFSFWIANTMRTGDITVSHGQYNFNAYLTGVWQTITIPGSAFATSWGNYQYNYFWMNNDKAGSTVYLDNVRIQQTDTEAVSGTNHTHAQLSVLEQITQALLNAWNAASTWITTNGANVLAHLANKQNSLATDGTGEKYPTVDAVNAGLATKLDTSAYNQHFKGVYLTFAALVAANPTGEAGDYAQVNVVGAADVLNYNWDAEESVWIPNAVGGSGATNTDELPEGTTNLYFTVTRFLANLTYANVIAALGFTPSTAPNDAQKNSDITKAEIEEKLTGEITSHTHPASGGTGYMVLADVQTVSGEKTFLNLKLGLRNVANTFTSFFTNANTAVRTYTLPNKSMTVAGTDDVALKQNLITGTVNRILKNVGTNLFGDSRLWDTGTFFGIGTIETPSKDITLGYQANREIGIEMSNSSTKGRDLVVSAGKTINYILNSNFLDLGQTVRDWRGMAAAPNGNVYAAAGIDIYMQTNGIGDFISLGQSIGGIYSMAAAPNGNVYAAAFGGGTIYMQTNGTGNFVSLGQTGRDWRGIAAAPNGNVYASVNGGDIYMQTNGVGNFVALGQTSRAWNGITVAPNGNVYAAAINGDIYMQTNGVGNFVALGQTSRNWRGMASAPNGNVYAVVEGGTIYMQTNGTGNFVSLGQTNRNYQSMAAAPNGNVYVSVYNVDIYMQNNDSVGAVNLDGGTLIQKAGTGKGTGKSRYEIWTGQKTASGTDMQLETLRTYVDENGYLVHLSTPIYADNAAALAGGLVVGTHYRTATGISMIVY